MDITIVIPTFGREIVINAVESVLSQTRLPNEIIVIDEDVDSKVSDELNTIARQQGHENILRHVQRECGGLTSAKNYAASIATGDVVLFLDDDATLDRDALEKLQSVYSSYDVDGVWIVSDEEHSSAALLYEKVFHHGPFHFGLRECEHKPEQVGEFQPLRAMGGCGMSVRSYVLDDFAFDESDPVAFLPEDIDFAYRVSERYRIGATAATHKHHKQVKRNDLSPSELKEDAYRKVYAHDYLYSQTLNRQLQYFPHYLLATIGVLVASLYTAVSQRRPHPLLGSLSALRDLLRGRTVEQKYLETVNELSA